MYWSYLFIGFILIVQTYGCSLHLNISNLSLLKSFECHVNSEVDAGV